MILAFAVLALGLLAALTPTLTVRFGRDAGYPLAVGYVAVGALLVTQMPAVLRGDPVTGEWTWLPGLGVPFSLRLDGLSLLFSLLVLGVGALIMAYCARYLTPGQRHTRWYVLLTLFGGSMLGLLLAADLVVLYVFWELTTVTSFMLIGTAGPTARRPAVRALVVTLAGGLALLVAVVLVWVAAGTTHINTLVTNPQLVLDSPLAAPIGALVVAAALTKSAQLPLHFWLPDAMIAITPVSAYLHAAAMVKAGVYLLLRLTPLYAGHSAWVGTLVSVGLASAVIGAFLALRRYDLKELLAYSTVSQLGLLVASAGVGTPAAISAASAHTFSHALYKATLFMLIGIIDKEAGSRDIRELSGLWRVMPVTASLTGLAALSLAGVPPLLGFVSKETIFQAMLDIPGPAWAGPAAAAGAVAASALTFAYGARIFYDAFGGPTLQEDLYEPAAAFLAPAALPAVLGLVFGPGVALLNPLVQAAEESVVGEPPVELEFWHGLTPEVALTAVIIVVGTVLFLRRGAVDRVLHASRLRVHGSAVFDAVYDGLIASGGDVGRPFRSLRVSEHLPWILLAVAGLGAAGVVAVESLPPRPEPVTSALDVPVLVLLGAAVLSLVLTQSRLAVVGLLSVTGLVVAAWFMLVGAPDLALALLLVEILTVVVAMLVLRGLPPQFQRPQPGFGIAVGALAVATGAAAGLATYAFTGRRELSAPGRFFLEEAEPLTGGTNVVNTILVDFRALDTLGEATVLLAVALGLRALLDPTRPPGGPQTEPVRADVGRAVGGGIVSVAGLVLMPVMLVLSAYLFLRGHDQPGGGFSAALVAGTAVALAYLARGAAEADRPSRLRVQPMVAAGLLVAVTVGTAVLAAGRPLLTPVTVDLGPASVTSSLVFDFGVYVSVLALATAAVLRLGRDRSGR